MTRRIWFPNRPISQKLAEQAAPKSKNAPDVVLILFDDLGHGDVGFTGQPI
jgi:hypothetical protein